MQVGTGAALIDEVHRLIAEGEHGRLIITDVRMPG